MEGSHDHELVAFLRVATRGEGATINSGVIPSFSTITESPFSLFLGSGSSHKREAGPRNSCIQSVFLESSSWPYKKAGCSKIGPTGVGFLWLLLRHFRPWVLLLPRASILGNLPLLLQVAGPGTMLGANAPTADCPGDPTALEG